jgi:aminoglycoside phosphotransferase (APT) family kinase protein
VNPVGHAVPGPAELRRREGELLRQLRAGIGATEVTYWRHGADFAAYRVRAPAGRVVARIPLLERIDSSYDGDVDYAAVIGREVAAYRVARPLGLTPRVLAVDVSRTAGPYSWMVLSEAPGEDLAELDGDQAAALGRFARRLHGLRPGAAEAAQLEADGGRPHTRALRRLATVERHASLPGTPASRRAALGWALDRLPADRVLLHMDLRPSNLRGAPGRLDSVLDWSNARLGHPWEEIGRMDAFGLLSADFLSGYGAARADFTDPAVTALAFDTHALLAAVAVEELDDGPLHTSSVAGATRCLEALLS